MVVRREKEAGPRESRVGGKLGLERRKSNQYSQSNVCNETTKIEKETLRLNLFATR